MQEMLAPNTTGRRAGRGGSGRDDPRLVEQRQVALARVPGIRASPHGQRGSASEGATFALENTRGPRLEAGQGGAQGRG